MGRGGQGRVLSWLLVGRDVSLLKCWESQERAGR